MTGKRVWEEQWPEADRDLLVAETFELVVQVNGKLRDRIEVPADASEEEQERLARQSPKVESHLNGRQVAKTVVVAGQARQLRRSVTAQKLRIRGFRVPGPGALAQASPSARREGEIAHGLSGGPRGHPAARKPGSVAH